MGIHALIEGGVTSPRGYRASGVKAGIKADKLDLALLLSTTPAAVAGLFTSNKVCAAPVKLCRRRLAGGLARAIVVNSGCANACTGAAGMAAAEATAAKTAKLLDVPVERIFVCSTGTIGKPLPLDKVVHGVQLAAAALGATGGGDAARAIMTTDTVPKEVAAELTVDGQTVRIGGMAKGAGMIEPNMATMLAFITTDAAVAQPALQRCLAAAVRQSFNCISVDGDQSTNDTVLMLANGVAGNATLDEDHPAWADFQAAVSDVARTLALKLVKDGEGATKLVTVTVDGAADDAAAARVARAIANSLLVKTAWFGGDPNWGRVIAAVGYAGVAVDEDRIDIDFDNVAAVRNGCPSATFSLAAVEAVYAKPEFTVRVGLNGGKGCATIYTCDCSYEYVRINAEYMT
jgi:glutamate N-acetyltransferase / amino-acid N-acetyltransferase